MRKLLCKFTAAAGLFFATTPAAAAPTPGSRPTVRTLAAEEARLAEMAYRMATANAPYCSHPKMLSGVIFHDLTQYQPSQRAQVARAFSLNGGFGVLQIVRGSAAARAGLRIDDEIIAVGNVSVEDFRTIQGSEVSFRRAQYFSDLLQTYLSRGSTSLVVRRAGTIQTLRLTGERGCGGELSLSESASLNAWSDGRHIVLTTGMDNFARTDDEIAFVIAHEMAHNILGHFAASSKMSIFGVFRSRNYELEADAYAVRLMNTAGYQPTAGIDFLARSQKRLWWAVSLDHPGFGSRIKAVAQEIGREQSNRSSRLAANERPDAVMVTAAGLRPPTGLTKSTRSASREAPKSVQVATLARSPDEMRNARASLATVFWAMPRVPMQP